MHVEDALRYVEELLAQQGKRLNDVQRAVFRGSWLGKSYKEIRRDVPGVKVDYIMKDVGPGLWNLLSEVIGEEITKKNLKGPVERSQSQKPVLAGVVESQPSDRLPLNHEHPIPFSPSPLPAMVDMEKDHSFWADSSSRQDWDSAPDVPRLCGRDQELEQLRQWLTLGGCRLITIYGIGGVGKTDLSVTVAQEVRDLFDCVIWRSLSNWQFLNRPPMLDELLPVLVQFLSNQQEAGSDLSRLMHYLTNHACLIILDGYENVLQQGVHDGSYRAGYEPFGDLLRRVGNSNHQSCLLLTSQDKPREVALMEGGERAKVRSLRLDGLRELGGKKLFAAKGEFDASEADWSRLIRCYDGNPLALNVVATRIREVFDGKFRDFLEQSQQETLIFDDICDSLQNQFERLSELEKTILHCLAAYHEPIEISEIQKSQTAPLSYSQLQDGLQSLLRRSLIEIEASRYWLHPLMATYVLNHQQFREV